MRRKLMDNKRAERHYKAWLTKMGYQDDQLPMSFVSHGENGWDTIFNPSPLLCEWALQDEAYLTERGKRGEVPFLKIKERERHKSQWGVGITRRGKSLWFQYHQGGKT